MINFDVLSNEHTLYYKFVFVYDPRQPRCEFNFDRNIFNTLNLQITGAQSEPSEVSDDEIEDGFEI